MRLKELRERYSTVAQRMHSIVEAAEKEDRGLNENERSEFDQKKAEAEQLKQRIADVEATEARARSADATADSQEQENRERHNERRASFEADPNRPLTSTERMRAIAAWMTRDVSQSQLLDRAGLHMSTNSVELLFDRGVNEFGERFNAPKSRREAEEQSRQRREQQRAILRGEISPEEVRAMSTLTAAAGLNLVPDEMMRPIDIAMAAHSGMRRVAEIFQSSTGAPLPIPTVDDTAQEGEITTESAAMSEQDATIGQTTLGEFMFTSDAVKASYQLLQDSATNMNAFLGRILGERVARKQNKAFTIGVGTTEPFGIVTGATDSTVTTAAAQVTWSEVLQLKHSVNDAYREMGAGFMGSDTMLLNMKQIQDANGRPLWLPSLSAGEPDLFDGDPFTVNNHMASGSSAKALIYGQLSKYLIRDILGFQLIRMDELFIMNLQVGFAGIARADGVLVDPGNGPVKYLTMAV